MLTHGGSYFEESEWWTKPRRINHLGDLRVMFSEILLFRSPSENRIRTCGGDHYSSTRVVLHRCLRHSPSWPRQRRWPHVPTLAVVATALGASALSVAIVGAWLYCLASRLRSRTSRDYTHAADYFHLAVIGLTAILLFAGTVTRSYPASSPSSWRIEFQHCAPCPVAPFRRIIHRTRPPRLHPLFPDGSLHRQIFHLPSGSLGRRTQPRWTFRKADWRQPRLSANMVRQAHQCRRATDLG